MKCFLKLMIFLQQQFLQHLIMFGLLDNCIQHYNNYNTYQCIQNTRLSTVFEQVIQTVYHYYRENCSNSLINNYYSYLYNNSVLQDALTSGLTALSDISTISNCKF